MSRKRSSVIAHLTHERGRNIHDKGIVDVTENCVSSLDPLKDMVGLETGLHFYSSNEQNTWGRCYFKE